MFLYEVEKCYYIAKIYQALFVARKKVLPEFKLTMQQCRIHC